MALFGTLKIAVGDKKAGEQIELRRHYNPKFDGEWVPVWRADGSRGHIHITNIDTPRLPSAGLAA